MSDAISLLSVLAGVRSGGQSVRGEATLEFEALFLGGAAGDGTEGDVDGGGAKAEAGAAALKKMYSFLAGLAKKTAVLRQPDGDPAQTLEQVAALANDLAAALAEFDWKTGLSLLQVLTAGLPDGGGVEIAPSVVPADGTGQGAAEDADLLVDPAAAVQALQSVIAGVVGALRGISATAPARAHIVQTVALAPQEATVAVAAQEVAADGAAVADSAAAKNVAGRAAPAVVAASEAAAVLPDVAPVAPDTTLDRPAGQPVAAASLEEAEPMPFFLPPQGGWKDDTRSAASQALMARVVAAASAALAPAGAAEVMQGPVTPIPEAVTEVTTRRVGPMERLIAPEDIARALAREGQAGRDPVAAVAQTRANDPGAEAPRFAAALADQVRSAEVGEGRTRIELSPRGLGSIEVDVTTRDDGTLQVIVRAENPAVLNSLRNERDLLAQALGGLDAGSLDLQSFSDGTGQEPQRDRGAAPARPNGEKAAATGGDPAPAPVATIGAGRLDIMT